VAAFALFAKRTAVAIIFFVATATGAGRLAKFLASFVATVAGDFAVLAFKFEIGVGVIKRVAIQTDNIGIAAFVIGVTLFARWRLVLR